MPPCTRRLRLRGRKVEAVMLSANVRFALTALAANKLRATLTMLGIIIGVAAVITLVSVGRGVESFIVAEFQGLGNNLLFIVPGQLSPDQQGPRRAGGGGLTMHDYQALADPFRAPDLTQVMPAFERPAVVTRGNFETRTLVSGVTEVFPTVRNFSVVEGNFFNFQDVTAGARVAVLGQAVYRELFPNQTSPVGEDIKINGILFRVIGLMEDKGASGFQDQNDVVLVPLSTAQSRLYPARRPDGLLSVDYILAEVVDESRQDIAIADIEIILRETHQLAFDEEDDFSVLSQEELIGAFSEVTNIVTIFLGVIAGISLLVGGIGIMNIMLVSVTERTREIGLRKSVGARRRDILWQFLVEAVLLALLGGVIGLVVGVIGAVAIAYLSDVLQPTLAWESVVLAVTFSAGVGLFFGIYPATRAAALHPIEALRYE